MDIKDKLAYYKSKTQPEESKQQNNISPSLKALAEKLDAEICHPSAPFLKVSRSEQLNPSLISSDFYKIDLSFLEKKKQNPSFSLNDCIFFDLETTGLMGGSGTFAFLLGFASVSDNQIHIDQYFLPDFGREYYLFKELNEFIKPYKNLVSYNGKSYDHPLLRSRYIMNQLEPSFTQMVHHDLLHFARRVWKEALPACDLISIEENILNRYRDGDIPGWMIPQSYFDFLNTGVIHNMVRIIEHNYFDLLSLVELIIVLNRISQKPESENNVQVLNCLANLAFQQDNIRLYDQICISIEQRSGKISPRLMVDKSIMHKRKNDWSTAIRIWDELIETSSYTLFALEELAKYYEHQKKSYNKALEYTQRALNALDLLDQLNSYDEKYEDYKKKFTHRYDRLKLKMS
jgi:uncharacterized protein YprB with RNaseH-like and TPR domain